MALGENLTENGLVRIASGTALAMRAGVSLDVMEVHRMLAHPSEDITRKTVEMVGIETTSQWGKGARRIPRQEVALGASLTENGLVRITSGTALAMRAGVSRDVMEVHRMLAHPSEDIMRKTAEMVGIETTGQWGACETCFQAKAKRHAVPKKTDERASVRTRKVVERQAVQWVDGPKKTGGDGTGKDDRSMKSAGDRTIVERETPQLNVQELGQEQQLTLHEHDTQEAFSEHEGETQGTFSKLEEETQEALSKVEEETQEALLEHEREQQEKDEEAGPASGSAIWRDRPYPRCVSSPSTGISRPYCHHVRGVEDPTPLWRKQHCIVSCR